MAVITKTNVTELVQMYFELRRDSTSVKEKCEKMYVNSKLPMRDIYNIFWAIRILTEPGYDHDDIEFHVNNNPIFAEIPSDYNEDEHAEKQVGLLRQAIRDCQLLLSSKINMVPLESKL